MKKINQPPPRPSANQSAAAAAAVGTAASNILGTSPLDATLAATSGRMSRATPSTGTTPATTTLLAAATVPTASVSGAAATTATATSIKSTSSAYYDRRPSQLVLDFRSNDLCLTEDAFGFKSLANEQLLSVSAPSSSSTSSFSGMPSRSLSIKSITAASVSSGRDLLLMDHVQDENFPPFGYRRPSVDGFHVTASATTTHATTATTSTNTPSSRFGARRSNNEILGLEVDPLPAKPTVPASMSSMVFQDVGVQTDPSADDLMDFVDKEDEAFVTVSGMSQLPSHPSVQREYNEPQGDEDSDPEMDPIRWIIGLDLPDVSKRYRATAPDADMMTIGRRLGLIDDSPVEQECSSNVTAADVDLMADLGMMDLNEEPSSSGSNDVSSLPVNPPPSPRSNKSSSFSIVPPFHVVKPKSVRPSMSYLLDMNPASPPSSELTVPSESGSESSYSTNLSPDSTKVAYIASNEARSAFSATHYLREAKDLPSSIPLLPQQHQQKALLSRLNAQQQRQQLQQQQQQQQQLNKGVPRRFFHLNPPTMATE